MLQWPGGCVLSVESALKFTQSIRSIIVITAMNISRYDLNLLVCLDVLLRERNVTRAAAHLNITQPAMSNSLKRLREMFGDPLLVRTSQGMEPTERALDLQPQIRKLLIEMETVLQPVQPFDESSSNRLFRIMASDYAASTLLPVLLTRIQAKAPGICFDVMTPSDVTFHELEDGKVDMAINMFEELPLSFHQKLLWQDPFVCLLRRDHPGLPKLGVEAYLAADHVWVSKTGYGVGVGVRPDDLQKLGWVDKALAEQGHQRRIKVFTRNYHVAMDLAQAQPIIATIPSRAALLHKHNNAVVITVPPLPIPPIALKMVWSPLLHHDASHIWLRRMVQEAADSVPGLPQRG